MKIRVSQSRALNTVYLANILLAFHWYTILYLNSSFVSTFVTESKIGFLYIIGALVNLFLLLSAPRLISWIGNYLFIITAIILEATAVVGLALCTSVPALIFFFILHLAVVPMILFSLDIFLEKYTLGEGTTGSTRGTFLTLGNIALVISPALVSLVLTNTDFYKVYLLSALFLIPLLVFAHTWKEGPDKNIARESHILKTLQKLRASKNLYLIWKANFILQLFYACMVIYLPIHLYQYIGFSLSEIAAILTIMFLPFVIFEFPVGKLADKRLGEKEILSLGFIIAGIATALIAIVSEPIFGLWALILFTTRIGASFIEITSESYFFKNVDSKDVDLISFFRMTRPISFVVAPLVATALLVWITYGALFGLVGLMMICGLRYSLVLIDTK